MRRRLFELIVGLGIMASGAAAAQSPSYLDTYALRGGSADGIVALDEVIWSASGRYWHSMGKTTWNHDASRVNPLAGNPTSRLDYERLRGTTGEVEIRGEEATGIFGRALFGIGAITGGRLRDRDWFAGQIKFSDTMSTVKGGTLTYAMIDGGWALSSLSGGPLTTRMFAGYGFWGETAPAHGARCLPDDVGNTICPLGEAVPTAGKVISNQAQWHMVRLGLEAQLRIGSMLTLSGEVAVVPIGLLVNADSHRLRRDLGPSPNIFTDGAGFGVQAQVLASVNITPNFSIGVGGRYWHMETYSESAGIRFGNKDARGLPVNRFSSDRYGLLANATGRF
jgi:hypothetical protein